MESNPAFSDKKIYMIAFVIMGLYPLVGMGVDLIAPSLPAISADLQTSNNFSKNLITLYLLGYATGNFIIGILSDALGRKNLMRWGLFIFTIVSLLPALFEKPFVLLLARFAQGFSIAAFAVISRAMLSDILPKDKLIKYATILATMWGIGPVIGPVIGGYLQYYLNWRACFYFFGLMGCIGFFATLYVIPETHFLRQPLQYQQLKNNFSLILTHRLFIGSAALMGITYSWLIVFNTLGPFLIQTSLGYSSIYFGHIALLMGLLFLFGTMLCRRLLKNISPESFISYAILFCMIIAVLGLGASFIAPRNIWIIVVPSLGMFLGCGLIYPAAMGKGLSLFRHLAGSGAAVMNLINILITSFIAFIMSFMHIESAIPINFIYCSLLIFAVLVYYYLIWE